jgi:hypothetical protein
LNCSRQSGHVITQPLRELVRQKAKEGSKARLSRATHTPFKEVWKSAKGSQ